MKRCLSSASLFFITVCTLTSNAQDARPSFVVFDAPESTSTAPSSINAFGAIAGAESGNPSGTGFVRDRSGNFHRFAGVPVSINIIGTATGSVGTSGFVVDINGNYTAFSVTGANITTATSINAEGTVCGQTSFPSGDSDSAPHGFVRYNRGIGLITVFDPPTSSQTHPTDINSFGQVVGEFEDVEEEDRSRGFIFFSLEGTFTYFDASVSSTVTTPTSINDLGYVTGQFMEPPDYRTHGFVRDPGGNVIVFDAPNADNTMPLSINSYGDVTGSFGDVSQNKNRGFIRKNNGAFIVFDAPNAVGTFATGINDLGQVTGYFSDQTQNDRERGFIREP